MREDFSVSNDGISAAFEFISRAVQSQGAGETIAHRLSIIVDELCANMIRHDDSLTPDQRFELELHHEPPCAVLTIRDGGVPFDPLAFEQAERPEIGGHGIALVKGLANKMSYARIDGRNCLTVMIDGRD